MTPLGPALWRFDSLDPRAGLGFASYRGPDLLQTNATDVSLPAVFLSAPDFRPVRLLHRGLGLAATRGSFQHGLFVAEPGAVSEVGFDSLESLSEFMRRCYGMGASGDGPDRPEGGGPLPVPDDPLGDAGLGVTPSFKTEGEGPSMVDWHRKNVLAFAAASKETQLDASAVVSFRSGEPTGQPSRRRHRDGAKCLERGAHELAKELVHRLPASVGDFGEWHHQSLRFGGAMHGLGLEGGLTVTEALHKRVQDKSEQALWPHLVLPFIFGSPTVMEVYRPDLGLWTLASVSTQWSEPDPLDFLESLPIPTILRHHFPDQTASVLDLLGSFVAAPVDDPAVLAVALFAAACIVSIPHMAGGRRFDADGVQRNNEAQVTRLAERAKEWLDDQLPRRAFHPRIEALIPQTAKRVVNPPSPDILDTVRKT